MEACDKLSDAKLYLIVVKMRRWDRWDKGYDIFNPWNQPPCLFIQPLLLHLTLYTKNQPVQKCIAIPSDLLPVYPTSSTLALLIDLIELPIYTIINTQKIKGYGKEVFLPNFPRNSIPIHSNWHWRRYSQCYWKSTSPGFWVWTGSTADVCCEPPRPPPNCTRHGSISLQSRQQRHRRADPSPNSVPECPSCRQDSSSWCSSTAWYRCSRRCA